MNGVAKLLEATVDLNNWAKETGQRLPFDAEAIAMAEQAGVYLNLADGKPVGMVDDEVQTLDDRTWLADLEQACGGNVVITWAMSPEEYFAKAARGEL